MVVFVWIACTELKNGFANSENVLYKCCFVMLEKVGEKVHFLPCDAVCTVSVIVILSVRLSVTLVDCVHMVRPTIMISSPQGSPIILVSGDITTIPKFEGGHPERGR